MNWFLYDRSLRHERVNKQVETIIKTFWKISQIVFENIYAGLREKCPNTELFLVHIFLYSDWTQENTDQK